jgi:hypothetical protein
MKNVSVFLLAITAAFVIVSGFFLILLGRFLTKRQQLVSNIKEIDITKNEHVRLNEKAR